MRAVLKIANLMIEPNFTTINIKALDAHRLGKTAEAALQLFQMFSAFACAVGCPYHLEAVLEIEDCRLH